MNAALLLVVITYVGVGALVFADASRRLGAALSLAIAVLWPVIAASLMLQKEPGN